MKVSFANFVRDEQETQVEGTPVTERIKENILDVEPLLV